MIKLLFFLVLFSLIYLSKSIDKSYINAPVILLFSLIGPMIYFSIELDILTYFVFFISALLFIVSYYIAPRVNYFKNNINDELTLNVQQSKKIKLILFKLFFLSQVAFFIKLFFVLNTLGIDAYIYANSKGIELVFGKSTILNYIFNLNMYTAPLATYMITAMKIKSRSVYLILFFSLFELMFTGIKSTFIFGALFVYFVFYFASSVKLILKILPLLMIFAITIILFVFVNLGGNNDSILLIQKIKGYVYYNYINFDLEVLNRTSYTFGKYTFFFITKLFNQNIKGYFDTNDFNLLDINYNMGTFLREYYVDFGIVGVLVFMIILGYIGKLTFNKMIIYNSSKYTIINSIFLTATAFAFFGNQFIRLQFWFIIVIAILVDKKIRNEVF